MQIDKQELADIRQIFGEVSAYEEGFQDAVNCSPAADTDETYMAGYRAGKRYVKQHSSKCYACCKPTGSRDRIFCEACEPPF